VSLTNNAILFAFLSASTTGFSLDLFKRPQVQNSKVRQDCANFSGNWQGTCTGEDGETRDDTVNLFQEDCSKIKKESSIYLFDTIVTVVRRYETEYHTYTTNFAWTAFNEFTYASSYHFEFGLKSKKGMRWIGSSDGIFSLHDAGKTLRILDISGKESCRFEKS